MSSEVWSKGSFHLAADDHDQDRKMKKVTTHEVIKKQTNTKEIHEVMTIFKIWHMGVIRCAHRIAYYNYLQTTADGCVSKIQIKTPKKLKPKQIPVLK